MHWVMMSVGLASASFSKMAIALSWDAIASAGFPISASASPMFMWFPPSKRLNWVAEG
jgi:hypothetical protein